MTKVTITPQTYEVGGREFDNQKEADAWAAMLDAKGQFENARDHFAKKLAETYRTADGEPFKWKLFTSYWRVLYEWGRIPSLEEVEIPYHTTRFDFEENDGELKIIVYRRQEGGTFSRLWQVQEFKVTELHQEKAAALEAVYQAQEKWIAEEHERIRKGREGIANRDCRYVG